MEASQEHEMPSERESAVPLRTPFADHYAEFPAHRRRGASVVTWVLVGAFATLITFLAGFHFINFSRDEFRTLAKFPCAEYLRNPDSVMGLRFKINITVEAELGADEGTGRLYSFREQDSQSDLAVIIPPKQGAINLVKGQSYVAEVEVGKGGLIYAQRLQKQ